MSGVQPFPVTNSIPSNRMDLDPPGDTELGRRPPYRGSRGRGARRVRDAPRTTEWRKKQNNKVIADRDRARDLLFAKPDQKELEAFLHFSAPAEDCSTVVPVSSQGVGFLANQYFYKIIEQFGEAPITQRCTIFEFYRYCLVQFTFRLYKIRSTIYTRFQYASGEPEIPSLAMVPSVIAAMETCELNVGFITQYINNIGPVTVNDDVYVPVLMPTAQNPLYFSISTLRASLGVLLNPQHNMYDYWLANNSVPGIHLDDNGLLTNLNQIIPPVYGSAQIFHDANRVRGLMNFIGAKCRDLDFYTGRLGKVEDGAAAILLGSTINGIDLDSNVRIPPSDVVGRIMPVIGNVTHFWSQVRLTEEQRKLGVLGLYVREDTGPGECPPTGYQNSRLAKQLISADYTKYLRRLIG